MASRLFRALLRLLPADFRDGYAREAEATFAAEVHDARARGQRGHVAGLWITTAIDVLRVAPREHADILWRDVRVALRAMFARPAHSLTAIVTVALGIGASVAMFSVIDAVLLAPLGYREANRLVMVGETRNDGRGGNAGYLTFVDVKARARSFSHIVAATRSTATFAGDGQDAERVNAMRVSTDYFAMIGVSPVLGRAFTADEDRPGAARRVAVLSDGLWRRRFGADPAIVGRVVDISGQPITVVGVMPRGFDDIVAARAYDDAALWVPLGYDPAAGFACRTCRHLVMFARLADGVSIAAAEAEVTGIIRAIAAEHPQDYMKPGARVETLAQLFLGPVRPALLLLAGGVALLFLVACANVASLLLLRASERSGEVAVRAALGVTRARLARQLLTEAVLLSGVGALLGLLPAWAAIRAVAVNGPNELPRLASLSLDVRAAGVAILLALASGVVFGLVPLRQLARREAADELRGAGRRSGSAGVWKTRAAIVAANVAMAAVLLAASGVLVRSVTRLLAVEPGVDSTNVLTLKLWAGGPRFDEGDTSQQIRTAVTFYGDLLTRIRALPGVVSASATTVLPLGRDVDGMGVHVVGRTLANPEDAPMADRFAVTPDYFATLGIPLVRGRVIDASDRMGAANVAVVNREAAETIFAGDDAIGRQVVLGDPKGVPRTVVGIVGDVRHHGLDVPAGPQVYVPQSQWAWAETQMTLVVKSAGDPSALVGPVRAIVREVDPAQPVTDVSTYAAVVGATTATRRFVAAVLGVFAVTALLLAAVGLYGALSVTVAQRRLEIGIRLALGAHTAAIRSMVFTSGLTPVAVGLAIGLAGGLVVLRMMTSLLFEVRPADPAALACAAAVMLATGAVACALPAWRASKIDAARSLRAE